MANASVTSTDTQGGRFAAQNLVGQVIDDRYAIRELIARGGTSVIYRAQDVQLRRTVALKVIMTPRTTMLPLDEDRIRRLKREGLIDVFLSTGIRGGKSAAANLGLAYCTGDIVVIGDIDTSFDRNAIAEIARPFADPRIGAVCGNLLGVRYGEAALPRRWLSRLEGRDDIARLADDFAVQFTGGRLDPYDYPAC